jgi:hypothetical protein
LPEQVGKRLTCVVTERRHLNNNQEFSNPQENPKSVSLSASLISKQQKAADQTCSELTFA